MRFFFFFFACLLLFGCLGSKNAATPGGDTSNVASDIDVGSDDDDDPWTACGICVDGDHDGPDCEDGDPSLWQYLEGFVDADDDGYTVGGSEQVCSGPEIYDGWSATALV